MANLLSDTMRAHNFKNLLDRRFGRLIVKYQVPNRGRKSYWFCLCDCGRTKIVSGTNLRSRQVISCGCARLDAVVEESTTHGLSKTNNHYMWVNAKQRAKKTGVSFDLNPEDINIPEFCPVLGIKLEKGIGKLIPASPSVDRIIPERGYIRGNIRVISHRANLLKSNATTEELEKILMDSYSLEIFAYA
jgi:hypothetical protein